MEALRAGVNNYVVKPFTPDTTVRSANRLAAIEPASAIAVPTVSVGSDFSTMYISAVRRVGCPFTMNGHDWNQRLLTYLSHRVFG